MKRKMKTKEPLLTSQIQSTNFVNFGWIDEIRKYVLTIRKPITPVCSECQKRVTDILYFCPQLKTFYHHKCLLKKNNKHNKLKKFNRHGVHRDHPIWIEVMKEGK